MKPSPRLSGLLSGLALSVVLAACASRAPVTTAPASANGAGGDTGNATTTSAAVAPELCDLVLDRPEVEDPDHHARAVADAEKVFAAMHDELLACYKKRVAASPQAHAFMTMDAIIGPDGRVLRVETTGGALLGEATRRCITDRIERATFEPPHGGGTLRVHVPFALRKVAPGEAP